jgi:hypothetical protein
MVYYIPMVDQEMQKYIKQVRDEANEDMKRHVGAYTESVDNKLAAIAEIVIQIKEVVDHHTEILDSHSERLTSIENDLKGKVNYEEFILLKTQVAVK